METNTYKLLNVLVVMGLIIIMIGVIPDCDPNSKLSDPLKLNKSGTENKLINILEYEIRNSNLSEDSKCYDYSKYYNKTLKENYPNLDVRWDTDWYDICDWKNNKNCDSTHTFVIVIGYYTECILDQTSYTCLEFPYLKEEQKRFI